MFRRALAKILIASFVISIFVLLTGCGHGPGPDDIIRKAYAWYVRELKSGVNPLEQKRTELQQFVTEGFLTSIDNMRPDLEASPFMDAQSFDATLSIEKITKSSRGATVRILAPVEFVGIGSSRESRKQVDDREAMARADFSDTLAPQ